MVWKPPSIWPGKMKLVAPVFGLVTLVAVGIVLQELIAADVISR